MAVFEVKKGIPVTYIVRAWFRRFGLEISRSERLDNSFYVDHYPALSLSERRFYNFGAGGFSHPYWTNVDLATDWYAGVQSGKQFISFDFMSLGELPIPSGVGEVVYSSHTIEHISVAAAENMFREAYRILKPGGVLRLTTPDFDLEYAAYKRGDAFTFYWIAHYSRPGKWEHVYTRPLNKAALDEVFLEHFATQLTEVAKAPAPRKYSATEIRHTFDSQPAEAAVEFFTSQCRFDPKFPGSHINWWNFRKAERMLRDAGFATIWKSGYGQSMSTVLRDTLLFDCTHPKISLHVEAVKT